MTSEEWQKKLEQSIEKYPEATKKYLLLNQALNEELKRIDELVQKQSYHLKGIKGVREKIEKRKEFASELEKLDKEIFQDQAKDFTKYTAGLLKEITEPSKETKEQIAKEKNKRESEAPTQDQSITDNHDEEVPEARIQEELSAEEIKQQKIQEIIKQAQEARSRIREGRKGFER